jgi:hypothetical protein
VLTKVTALVLLLPLALELWENRRTRSLWNGVWLVLAPFSLVLWILLRQFLLTGQGLSFSGPYGLLTPFISQDFQAGWSTEVVSLPWDSLIAAVLAPARLWPHIDALVALVDVVMTVVVVYLIALTLRLPRRSYIVYTLAVFVMNLMLIVQSTPLIDAPRRWMMAFPLFIAAAIYLPRRWERLWILFAVPLQLALTVLFIKWIMAG